LQLSIIFFVLKVYPIGLFKAKCQLGPSGHFKGQLKPSKDAGDDRDGGSDEVVPVVAVG
jgi:hypothetical protein